MQRISFLLLVSGLATYSIVLAVIELATSQDYVRQFFTDISGDVPFYAVNTSLSVFLLWGTALLFLVCLSVTPNTEATRTRRWFFAGQAAAFTYLGLDDRFMFHETLGRWFDVGDHYILAVVAVAQLSMLAVWGRQVVSRRGWHRLSAAAAFFALMIVFDAAVPHMALLRLTIEDIAKTWACFFFHLYGWETLLTHLNHYAAEREQIPATVCGKDREASAPAPTHAAIRKIPMSSARSHTVLVLGADERTVLPIARSLGRQGVTVHVGWCPPESPVCSSRYVTCCHSLAPPLEGDVTWCDDLCSLIAQIRCDIVIPATEPAVVALRPHRERLSSLTRLALTNELALSVALDKQKTEILARSLGLPAPDSQLVRTLGEAELFLENHSGPVIVKPLSSTSSVSHGRKCFVRTFSCHRKCRQFLAAHLNTGPPLLIQVYLAGHGVGVEFLAKNGRILSAFQHRRLHETSGNGSTYRESVPLESKLVNATTQLAEALNYTGVGMCEFRVDPQTGRWALLEINARFWGSLPLAVAAGADFPLYLYQMLLHDADDIPQQYRPGIRSRQLRPDIRWLWRSGRQRITRSTAPHDDENGWTINHIPLRQLLRDVCRAVTFRDGIDTFAWDDLRPALAELCSFVTVKPLRNRYRPATPMTERLRTEAPTEQVNVDTIQPPTPVSVASETELVEA
ncbi:MAG: hypothetical protein GY758_14545 [Fuerstiella sp.]|nr:hypothetical protein [Fuerstiella sp.]